jgi:potassium efflux system protein
MRVRFFVAVLRLLTIGLWMSTGISSAQDRELDLQQVRSLRQKVADDAAMDEGLRGRILKLYDAAISSLETAADNLAAAQSFERDRANVDRMVGALRTDLARAEPKPRVDRADELTVDQAEAALARERSRLAAHRDALRQAEQLAEERAQSRTEIARQLGAVDQELELLSDELRRQSQREAPPDLKLAARTDVQARREVALSKIDKLRASLLLLEARGALVPLEVDIARQRVTESEELVKRLEEISHTLRRQHAEESLDEVHTLCDEVSSLSPELATLAAQTRGLAEQLWGAEGVVARSDEATRNTLATRKHLAELGRITELTRRKFEAFGQRGSITRWWPAIPEDFPELGTVETTIDRLDSEIPEVEHQLITLEEERSDIRELARRTLAKLQPPDGGEADPEVVQGARDLIGVRRDLLDELIHQYGRYSNTLVENRTVSTHFRDNVKTIERFLYSHVLWARSVPLPIIPRPTDMADAFGWVLSPEKRQSISAAGIKGGVSVQRRELLIGLLLTLALAFRRRIKGRLAVLAGRVRDPATDAFGHTLEAVVLTALLATPLPLALRLTSSILLESGGAAYLHSTAAALDLVAWIAVLLEGTRQLFAPDGLAEAHFGWPSDITRSLHSGLLWPEVLSLPPLFVAIDLALAGIRLTSPPELQLYNNSLGRVAFIIAMLIVGLSTLALLRPEKKSEETQAARKLPWSQRFTEYAFPTALLLAWPVILIATIVPAVLAALGYYVTALLLAYQMLRTVLLGAVVLVGGGLVHRWRIARRNAARRHEGEEDERDPAREREMAAAEAQVRQLFRFVIVAVMAVGLWSIWSDALPMLRILKRVQLLPSVTLLEETELGGLEAIAGPGPSAAANAAATDASSSSEAETRPTVPGLDVTGRTAAAPAESSQLILWQLLEAILAAIVTLVLVRNIPGLVELFLQRRTALDTGVRVAIATLVRYTITIVGFIVVFGVVGLTWSNVQWLAAALTFGLGFGLQEIVANFVSGLILLVERPVRVGDVVTIGNLMGRVTRIQIRATTITLWDRSEMIVPNKEFITTKLVNWTLSDSKRRIEIPVRIAYGADLDRVKETLTGIAEQHPEVLPDPAPHTLLLAFGDDAIQFELRFVVDFGKGLTVKDEVQMAIDKAFHEQGIEFALPQLKIRLPEAGPETEMPAATEPAAG